MSGATFAMRYVLPSCRRAKNAEPRKSWGSDLQPKLPTSDDLAAFRTRRVQIKFRAASYSQRWLQMATAAGDVPRAESRSIRGQGRSSRTGSHGDRLCRKQQSTP